MVWFGFWFIRMLFSLRVFLFVIISPPCLLLCIYGSPFAVRYIYWASVRYSGALYSVMALEGAEEQLKSTFIDVHIIFWVLNFL